MTAAPSETPESATKPHSFRPDALVNPGRCALCHMGDGANVHLEWLQTRLRETEARLQQAESALARFEGMVAVPEKWAVFCSKCGYEWSVPHYHPGKSICAACKERLT